MRPRDTLNMIDVYEQNGKCFNVGDTVDMFVWVLYAEKEHSGVYGDPTIHIVLFQPSNIGYPAPLPFPRTSTKNEQRTPQPTLGPMVVATPSRTGRIGIANAQSNCVTSAMLASIVCIQIGEGYHYSFVD